MSKLKKGDEVIVITGKDKGKIGQILSVLNNKILVDGVNKVKKHVKPNPNANQVGGILDKNMPIEISNVAIYNTETKKRDKIGFKIVGTEKFRIYKSTKKEIKA